MSIEQSKEITILHFPYSSQRGGQETQTQLLCTELREKSWKLKFIGSKDEVLLEILKKDKFETKSYWLPKPPVSELSLLTFTILLPFAIWQAWRIIDSECLSSRVVICMSLGEKIVFTPLILLRQLFSKHKSKIIWMEHGGARINRYLSHNPYRLLLMLWSRLVTTITVSPRNAREFEKLGLRNVVAITNGVKNSAQCTVHSTQKIRIGFAGRLAVDKGIDTLIKAFDKLKKCELHIAGSGPLEKQLKNLEPKNTHWLGELDEKSMHKFYQNIDVFVLPSSAPESFGLAAAEAMMRGIPTIVTDHTGIADYINNNINGIKIKPHSVKALRSALEKLIKNKKLRHKIGDQGRQTAIENFSIKEMIKQYEAVFSD